MLETLVQSLRERIKSLELENAQLKAKIRAFEHTDSETSSFGDIPESFLPKFKEAEKEVKHWFDAVHAEPSNGIIEISGERYILIRGESLTTSLEQFISNFFDGRSDEAQKCMKDVLYDITHFVGKADARALHSKLNISDPIKKLAAGTIHFAFSGWGKVRLTSELEMRLDHEHFAVVDHLNAFEAETRVSKANKLLDIPSCFMSSGYASGWGEECFGQPCMAKEILCRAKGDRVCRFVVAHPRQLSSKILEYAQRHPEDRVHTEVDIPGYFGMCSEKAKFMNDLSQKYTALQIEREKVMMLLCNILPMSVIERMKKGDKVIAEKHPNATVLFADIVNFTKTISNLDSEVVVKWLNELFTHMDDLTSKYNLEKIKTIGDCYLLVGGIPLPREDHVEVVLNFAIDLLEDIKTTKDPHGNPVSLRIGVATGGPICSGVIGSKKIAFDVWGDTVNIAARMETMAQPDTIHCNESVVNHARDKFIFQERGPAEVKGKGTMNTFYCISKLPPESN